MGREPRVNWALLLLLLLAGASAQGGGDGGGGGGLRSNGDDGAAGAMDGLVSDAEGESSLDDIEGKDDGGEDNNGGEDDNGDEDSGKVGIVKKLISKLKKDNGGGSGGDGANGGGGGEAGSSAGGKVGGAKGGGEEEEDPYYCHHDAACGSRGHVNSGPATSDTLHNGYECFCRGPAQLGLKANCYRGHCYNPAMQSETYRAPRGVDTNGMCSYSLSSNSAADTEFCEVEPAEFADPNLRSFTDPPFLVNPEEEQTEIAAALRVGSEAMS